MTDTQKVQTKYGTVEVETVDCDSCGNTIAKDESHEFSLDNRGGHACEHCVDNGPISFPPSVDISFVGYSDDFAIWIALWPLLMTFGWTAWNDKESSKAMLGVSFGALLWTTLPLLLLIYFVVIP